MLRLVFIGLQQGVRER